MGIEGEVKQPKNNVDIEFFLGEGFEVLVQHATPDEKGFHFGIPVSRARTKQTAINRARKRLERLIRDLDKLEDN